MCLALLDVRLVALLPLDVLALTQYLWPVIVGQDDCVLYQ